MAQNYADMTGQLILTNITPIVKALFGDMNLKDQGGGTAYIALMSECDSISYRSVMEALADVANNRGLDYTHDDDHPMEVLKVLAPDFGVPLDHPLIEKLSADDWDVDQEPGEDLLFDLAMLFDDGHGLSAINTELAFHCSKPRQFEFGGCGFFAGKHFSMYTSSTNAGRTGARVNEELGKGDLAAAADAIFEGLNRLLDGIEDSTQRQEIKQLLAKQLTA